MTYTPWSTRRVGIELEFRNITRAGVSLPNATVARALATALPPVAGAPRFSNVNSCRNTTGNAWELKTDGSCGWEVASPPITLDAEGHHDELRRACAAIVSVQPTVDRACGLHVHVECNDFSWRDLQTLLKLWTRYEPFFYEMQPPSRTNNNYCRPWRSEYWTPRAEQAQRFTQQVLPALAATTEQAFLNALGTSGHRTQKYLSLNISRWWRTGTVEFRLAGGTLEYTKIRNWIKLLCALVNRVKCTDLTTPSIARTVNAAGFTTNYVCRTLGLARYGAADAGIREFPASNVELIRWIDGRRKKFHPTAAWTRLPWGQRRATAATRAGTATDATAAES